MTVNEYSYVTVELMDWFDMINAHLNPFAEPVGFGNVDIVYRDWDGSFHGTAGLRDPDYFPSPSDGDDSGDTDISFDPEKPDPTDPPEPTDPPAPTEPPVPTPGVIPTPPPETPSPIGDGSSGETQLG